METVKITPWERENAYVQEPQTNFKGEPLGFNQVLNLAIADVFKDVTLRRDF